MKEKWLLRRETNKWMTDECMALSGERHIWIDVSNKWGLWYLI